MVVVSSPNMTHYQILLDILNHPKPHHVLVEKPLCTTVAHCREVGNLVSFFSPKFNLHLLFVCGVGGEEIS